MTAFRNVMTLVATATAGSVKETSHSASLATDNTHTFMNAARKSEKDKKTGLKAVLQEGSWTDRTEIISQIHKSQNSIRMLEGNERVQNENKLANMSTDQLKAHLRKLKTKIETDMLSLSDLTKEQKVNLLDMRFGNERNFGRK